MSESTRPLRVLYSFAHALDWPGIATTALNQIRSLARRGVEVELYCTSVGDADLPTSVHVTQTMVLAGRRIPHRVLGVQNAYDRHDRIVAKRLKNGPRPDVVHVWPRACLRTLTVARQLGVPAVRECPNPHTASVYRESAAAAADAGVPLPSGHSHATDTKVLQLESAEFAAATALLAPSHYAAEKYLEEGIPARKVLRHRYGCDTAAFFPDERHRSAPGPLRACFLGRGDPTKGLHIALHAWLDAGLPPGSTLDVAGAVETGYRSALAAEFADESIRELGFVTDTAALLRSCDVLVLPTWTEGSALVTYEAQASGCVPLVTTASGSWGRDGADFVDHTVGDAAGLAATLRSMAYDGERLSGMREHLIANTASYSWDAAAADLESAYLSAMSM
ncbi:glycosyltransferase family 4 protein [Microbacterium sp. NPDC057650]|uniref:glycosyltransferase family 4 protein n=1 Tax=unclassified Microbacterium TaxID=2609290 RepID=UPI00366FC52A